jgi:uroporphyrin-III C-methyltransferase / precorrin-2 dehydrogenase / sirohydrochlorin ferrochelatase
MMTPRAPGRVSLVGAGPGDPDHLTQKAVRCLREADVVFYDALVSHEVRSIARHADQVLVGKRAGREPTPQGTIEQLLIEGARQGRRVVRLKGGDPFVFGRGGEEALALQAAGVPYEVVPGLTTAVAAPVLAGIPLTHRGTSSAFVVIAGFDEAAYGAIVDALAPASITIVAMMALASRAALSRRLLANGWCPSTPAAIVLGAGTNQMWMRKCRLDGIGDVALPANLTDVPGTLVVGDVVALPIESSADTRERTSNDSAITNFAAMASLAGTAI